MTVTDVNYFWFLYSPPFMNVFKKLFLCNLYHFVDFNKVMCISALQSTRVKW